ncbi:hypothetical protein SBRV1_gp42 [Sulfolobales Beppu rod-shaped virus 1]|uniref:Uncharacterized protein n=1 Tax=Sulfolobales Beppu rod-shaped virus 1 TaxID=2493121 RepID=A0A3S8NFD0_9VIRU|nr:hypothetical protein QIT32_gp42 [Sulfolobales Beppu rod-shaped virus 1]AZI75931.1 hypothetical protein SBRV1_gp42 [Sulfolobales Beppu rod-shaped virus 1]
MYFECYDLHLFTNIIFYKIILKAFFLVLCQYNVILHNAYYSNNLKIHNHINMYMSFLH